MTCGRHTPCAEATPSREFRGPDARLMIPQVKYVCRPGNWLLKRSLKLGFAGEDNDLFYDPKTMMVFGDAKATLSALVQLLEE